MAGKFSKKIARALWLEVELGVNAVHYPLDTHARQPRPKYKGFWEWFNQPIHMDIVSDPEHCKGCKAIRAAYMLGQVLK